MSERCAAGGERRFLDRKGSVYASELGRLAHELVSESKGAMLRRLECIYDEILIDEVQDLSSHDWGIVDVLLRSSIDIRMVGPGGYLNFPHPWPGQNPPPGSGGTVDDYAG